MNKIYGKLTAARTLVRGIIFRSITFAAENNLKYTFTYNLLDISLPLTDLNNEDYLFIKSFDGALVTCQGGKGVLDDT